MNALRARQRGAVLIIALIMLVMITLFVLSVMNMAGMNLRVAGNTQARSESVAAAQQAIEFVASTNFTATPPAASTVNVDINGDGTTDYSVAVDAPTCLQTVPIKQTDPGIDPTDPRYTGCFMGGGSAISLCANSMWDVKANVNDSGATGTGTNVSVHQGLGVPVLTATAGC